MGARSKAGWRLAAVFGVFVASTLIGMAVAAAFPEGGSTNCAPDDSVSFWFNNGGEGGNWTSSEKTRVRDWGAHDWEIYNDSVGNQLVSNWEGSSSFFSQVQITWENLNGKWGSTKCPKIFSEVHADALELDVKFREGGDYYSDLGTLATHEFGHIHGLGHTGDDDTFDGDWPTKMECNIELNTGNLWPSQDDWSAIYHFHNTEYSGKYTVTANPSFENNTLDFWAGTGMYMRSGGGSEGWYFVKLTSYGDYMFQTTRVTDGSGNASAFDARANYRRWSSSGGGTVQIKLRSGGPVTYSTSGSGCVWENIDTGDDANTAYPARTPAPLVTRATVYCTPTLSWNYCTTPDWTMPTSWQTGDVRIRVTNLLSGVQTLYVDNARARGKKL